MNIGIISMQKVINYGSFLQAYALKRIIEDLGHEANFIDIIPGEKIVHKSEQPANQRIKLDGLLKRIEHVLFAKKRKKLFQKNYFPMIGIDNPVHEEECDMLVIGSDEVFNCCQESEWGVTYQLFGKTKRPTITYAASAGYSSLSLIKQMGIESKIQDALRMLIAISVRDDNTALIIKNMGYDCEKHVDPVLIYNWDNSVPTLKHKYHDYILVYGYDNRINNDLEIAEIRKFAKQKGKQLISFGVYQRWCDKNVLCSPLELVSYFDHADYIITDTFHGTVISIKRNKKFATLIRDTNRNKILDLLETFNLKDRAVRDVSNLAEIIEQDIDYRQINDIVGLEANKSISYLKKYLVG